MIRLLLLVAFAAFSGETTDVQQVTTGIAADGLPPKGDAVKRLARRLEPTLRGQPDRITQYVDAFRRELANDPRLIAFEVTAAPQAGGQVRLAGFVEFPETRAALEKFLRDLGFQVDNRLETLPSAELGDRTLGFVKVPHTLSYDRPHGRRTAVTDCLLGESLFLLRQVGDQMLAHGGEGYLGYIPVADVHRATEAEFHRYLEGARVHVTADYERSDGSRIPAGARLKWIKSAGGSVTAELPGGERVSLPDTTCEVCQAPSDKIDLLIEAAQRLIGTRYVWGGRSSAGIDCSGLVQVAFAAVGWHLPRDANQQFFLGRLTATRHHPHAMRRGDTLYFLGDDGKIRHTAIYLGDGRYLNAEVPKVRVGSLNPDHEEYDKKRHKSFAFAKRLVE